MRTALRARRPAAEVFLPALAAVLFAGLAPSGAHAGQPSPACIAATVDLQQRTPAFSAQVAAIPQPKTAQDVPSYCARASALMATLQPQIDRWIAACAVDAQLTQDQVNAMANASRTFDQQCQSAAAMATSINPTRVARDLVTMRPATAVAATPTPPQLPASGLAVIGPPAAPIVSAAARATSGPATAN